MTPSCRCPHRGNRWTVYRFAEMPSGAAESWRLCQPCNPQPFDIEARSVNDRAAAVGLASELDTAVHALLETKRLQP